MTIEFLPTVGPAVWPTSDVHSLTVGPARIDFCAPSVAAEAIATRALRGAVHLCGAHALGAADEQPAVAAALRESSANFPDGMPLVWWARRRGLHLTDRVYGPTLMEDVIDRGRAEGLGHYLFGSTPEVLDSLAAAIERRWPGARVVGVEAPPFRDLTDDELDESVRKAANVGADVVWVGMGCPKQDLLVARMASTGSATYVAIGAAFDFIAGTKSQAPRWVQRAGLEWLFRLASEPRRLWKRYLVYIPRFLRILYRARGDS